MLEAVIPLAGDAPALRENQRGHPTEFAINRNRVVSWGILVLRWLCGRRGDLGGVLLSNLERRVALGFL